MPCDVLPESLGGAPSDAVTSHSSYDAVSKSYRRVLLKIHPDKFDASNFAAHYRATERFKIVSEKWHSFAANHKPAATSSATTGAAAAFTTAAAATPTASGGTTPGTGKAAAKGSFGFGFGSFGSGGSKTGAGARRG